ncbi:MAG: mannose-1-phosphate guanylyltransferase [Candidatus Acidiferrales bacterium]|jgi:mannose-1-phosphate guanylyltransferase
MRKTARPEALPVCAVLLAGGRGTRFWPRSRMRTPKQLLNITGGATMLRETVKRLESVVPPWNIWVVTNAKQAAAVRREMRGSPSSQVLAEPVGRNTAAAIGLAAIHLAHEHGDALMAVLPSDSYIADAQGYRKLFRAALELARTPGSLAVLGVPPTRPETGYGYIEAGSPSATPLGVEAYGVSRFAEKPELKVAQEYAASGKYFWNAGMFFWRVSTFLENLKQFLPATHGALLELEKSIGTKRYAAALRRIYPQLESISVDYAIMEPATRTQGKPRVSVIPAEIGWSDIGSWTAVYELLAGETNANVSAGPSFTLDAAGNYFWSPKKFVAAIGVRDVVLVETDDALLLCSRERSQDVGKIVKWLEEQKRPKLI